jgi:hypothetical protein
VTSEGRGSEPATPTPRGSRRETGEGHGAEAHGQAACFHSPPENSRATSESKEPGPDTSEEDAAWRRLVGRATRGFPQAARSFA